MNSIIVGLVTIAFGILGMTVWWWSFTELLRGLVPLVLIVFGVIALASGVSDGSDEKEPEDEELVDGD